MKLNDHQLVYELRHWETSTAMFGSLAEAAANAIERFIKERAVVRQMSLAERIFRFICLVALTGALIGSVYQGNAGLSGLFGIMLGTALERLIAPTTVTNGERS